MNRRIKELLKQSGLQPYYKTQEGQIEKFAELIVRECAVIATEGNSDKISLEILEHFGV